MKLNAMCWRGFTKDEILRVRRRGEDPDDMLDVRVSVLELLRVLSEKGMSCQQRGATAGS